MSREIENITNAFRKARKEGAEMLEAGRITFEEFAFVMLGFEEQIRQAGADF